MTQLPNNSQAEPVKTSLSPVDVGVLRLPAFEEHEGERVTHLDRERSDQQLPSFAADSVAVAVETVDVASDDAGSRHMTQTPGEWRSIGLPRHVYVVAT